MTSHNGFDIIIISKVKNPAPQVKTEKGIIMDNFYNEVKTIVDSVRGKTPISVNYWDVNAGKMKVVKDLDFSNGVITAVKKLAEEQGEYLEYSLVYDEKLNLFATLKFNKSENVLYSTLNDAKEITADHQLPRLVVETKVRYAINYAYVGRY